MDLIIESWDSQRGIIIAKHVEDRDTGFEKLKVRKIRASGIGRSCDAELFLSAAGVESQFDTKSLRIFEIGRVMEPVIARWMVEDGWELKHNDDDSLGMLMWAGAGIITGHFDVIGRHPKITENEWALLDIKTMNTRRFNAWSKNGVQSSDPAYFAQLLFYGYAWKYKKLGLVGMEKPTGDYEVEIFDFDKKKFDELYDRAKQILDADLVMASKDRKCDWCSKKESCEGTMTNPLPKIRDKKYLIDLVAHFYNAYKYTEEGNLIKLAPRYPLEKMLIPPDNIKFEKKEEPEFDDEWIIF